MWRILAPDMLVMPLPRMLDKGQAPEDDVRAVDRAVKAGVDHGDLEGETL